MATIVISKAVFSIMLTPNRGKLERNKGSNAQCIAHTTDVAIPKASQFTLKFIAGKDISNATKLQIICSYVYTTLLTLLQRKFAD